MTTTINTNAPAVNPSAAVEGAESDNIPYQSAMKNHSLMGTAMVTMGTVMQLFTELANSKFAQMTEKSSVSRDAQEMANRVDRVLAGLAKPDSTGVLPPDVIEYMRENNILVDGKQTIDEFLRSDEANVDSQWAANNVDSFVRRPGFENLDIKGSAEQLAKNADEKGILIDGQKASEWLKSKNGVYTKEDMSTLLGASRSIPKDGLTAIKAALESTSGRASDFVQQSQLKLQQLMQNFNTAVTMANSVQSMNAESTKSIAQSIR